MSSLLLEWQNNQQTLTQMISGKKAVRDKPATIGRDSDCDITVKDETRTVSGIHVGIFFDPTMNNFYLLNLTSNRPQPNPVIVDGNKIYQKEVILQTGSIIKLGKKVKFRVKAIDKPVSRKSKCSNSQEQHILPLEYLHGNCPIDGSVVMEEVEV